MKPLNPRKTICVVTHDGKEVERIPASAPNAEAYITELIHHYGRCKIYYEPDTSGGLWAMMLQK